MEERVVLKRGLQEISHLFITGRSRGASRCAATPETSVCASAPLTHHAALLVDSAFPEPFAAGLAVGRALARRSVDLTLLWGNPSPATVIPAPAGFHARGELAPQTGKSGCFRVILCNGHGPEFDASIPAFPLGASTEAATPVETAGARRMVMSFADVSEAGPSPRAALQGDTLIALLPLRLAAFIGFYQALKRLAADRVPRHVGWIGLQRDERTGPAEIDPLWQAIPRRFLGVTPHLLGTIHEPDGSGQAADLYEFDPAWPAWRLIFDLPGRPGPPSASFSDLMRWLDHGTHL